MSTTLPQKSRLLIGAQAIGRIHVEQCSATRQRPLLHALRTAGVSIGAWKGAA